MDGEGAVVDGKPHPAVVELRQQRLVYARLVAALGLPTGIKEDPKPRQRRSIRGVYQFPGAS